jgi:eukaryotic-like serine/threonine-protein kinase
MDASDPLSPHHRLRQERIRHNWHQQELASKLGTTPVTVSRWETGSQQPSLYFRQKLCVLFGKSPEELGLIGDVSLLQATVQAEASSSIEELPTSLSFAPSPQIEAHFPASKDATHKAADALPSSKKPGHQAAKVSKPSPILPPPSFSKGTSVEQQNRERLIRRVRSFWITGVLEQSLHHAMVIPLSLQDSPEAVENPWRLVLQEFKRPSTLFPAGTRIPEIYDTAEGELLILGEPGAGKTTLLLELAQTLLQRAKQEPAHPLPVVFNLSSWAQRRQPLTAWLIEELETKYQVPRKMSAGWITTDQILPLLDGLDEMIASSRHACIQAINAYHQTHHLVPLVVCCRVNEYRSQVNHLALSRAVVIEPLTTEQVNTFLMCIGKQAASLHLAFQNERIIQELATTPLMLTLLIMVYQKSSLEEIIDDVSTEVPQRQIFATYTQRMLQRRSARSPYSQQQTIHWLSTLAKQMNQENQAGTVFTLEQMQPTWLMKKWQRRLYFGLTTGPICGLLMGLANIGSLPFALFTMSVIALLVGLLFGWVSEPGEEAKGRKTFTLLGMRIQQNLATVLSKRRMIGGIVGCIVGIAYTLSDYRLDHPHLPVASRIVLALWNGLLDGIYMGLPLGLAIKLERRIEPVEALSWSWRGLQKTVSTWVRIGLVTAWVIGLILSLPLIIAHQRFWFVTFLLAGLLTALYLVLLITQISGMTRGLSKRVLDAQQRDTPNQGIRRSARYGAKVALMIAMITALMVVVNASLVDFGLPSLGVSRWPTIKATDISIVSMMSHLVGISSAPTPTNPYAFWTLEVLFFALRDGATLGLAAGLCYGGAAWVQHWVLRFLLWCTQCVPFNYPHFLDDATERLLLRKVGGGYIFVHRLLLEYFASLERPSSSQGRMQETLSEGGKPRENGLRRDHQEF